VCLDDSVHANVKDVEKNDDDILENEGADDIKMENEEGENVKDEEYNFYSFTVQDSEGKDVELNKYMGKVRDTNRTFLGFLNLGWLLSHVKKI
jgi:hypothetical protein